MPTWQVQIGGYLKGYGERLDNGCTLAHGIFLAGLQQQAIQNTVLNFMATTIKTAHLMAISIKAPE